MAGPKTQADGSAACSGGGIGQGLESAVKSRNVGSWVLVLGFFGHRFSYSEKKKRVVFKTPTMFNIENAFKLFPDAYFLILVRDGRSCVESVLNAEWSKWSFTTAVKKWTEGAKELWDFEKKFSDKDYKYMIVRLCK